MTRVTMPDTKSGRERKGRGKRQQLEHRLARRELEADDEPPESTFDATDAEYLDEGDERVAE